MLCKNATAEDLGRVGDFWCLDVCFVSAGLREAVQAGGPVDAAGCVQVAEETLSQPAPDL